MLKLSKTLICLAALTFAIVGSIWTLTSDNDPSSAKISSRPERIGQMKSFMMESRQRPRPPVTWQDAAGQDVSLKNFSGKVVMLNFWASWCSPCLQELPSIDRLQARLGGSQFTVVALNVDRSGKPVANRYKKKLNLDNLDLYLDQSNRAAKSLKLHSMPTTIIFDARGREVGRLVGSAEWDTNEAISLIQWFIENPNHADSLPPPRGKVGSYQ